MPPGHWMQLPAAVLSKKSICTGKGFETKSRSSFEKKYRTVRTCELGRSGVMGRCAGCLLEVISLWSGTVLGSNDGLGARGAGQCACSKQWVRGVSALDPQWTPSCHTENTLREGLLGSPQVRGAKGRWGNSFLYAFAINAV